MADFELQYLRHGKALCGKVFGTFVETFNRLVDFHANLKGDGDVSDDGLVTVDRADPAHPVIRLDRSRLPTGGSSGGESADLSGSAFGLVETKDGAGNVTGRSVCNCYWNAGGVTHSGGDADIGLSAGLVYAEFAAGADSLSVGVASGIDALADLQKDPAKYVFPLYLIAADGGVVDLRTAPQLQLLETFT